MEMSGKLYPMSCILSGDNVTTKGKKIGSWERKKTFSYQMVCGLPKDHCTLRDFYISVLLKYRGSY